LHYESKSEISFHKDQDIEEQEKENIKDLKTQ